MLQRPPRALLGVLAFAAWLRILFNDVESFSRADETKYLLVTRRLLAHGYFADYASLARAHLADPSGWPYPTPLRWGYFGLTTFVGRIAGGCNYSTLAWISTVAGVGVVGLAWSLGRRFVGERAALVGAALVALSPLQLALSRRALQDETTCAFALASLVAYVKLLDAEPSEVRRWAVVSTLLAALAMAIKETFVFYAPAFAWLAWSARREGGRAGAWALLPLASPIVFVAGYAALAGGVGAFVAMARCVLASLHHEYASQYYAGAPHRSLVDLLALCTPSTLLALFAVGALVETADDDARRGARRLAVLAALSLAVFSLRLQVLRFVVGIDVLACLLAGDWLARVTSRAARPQAWLVASVVVVGAIDLALFQRVFVVRGVYDPTTDDVLRALDMLPR